MAISVKNATQHIFIPKCIVSYNVSCFKFIVILVVFYRTKSTHILAGKCLLFRAVFPLMINDLSSCIFPVKGVVFEWIVTLRRQKKGKKNRRKMVPERITELIKWVQLNKENEEGHRELQIKAKLKIKEKLHQIVKQPTTN